VFDAIETMHLIAFTLEKYLKLQMSSRRHKIELQNNLQKPSFFHSEKQANVDSVILSSCRNNFHFCTGFHISILFFC